uniref:oxaloacetate tautomerase n=1 Tax=Culicoides sonorensis TaxID=179676 RepID=A0A336JZ89_CULSO
MAANNFEKVCRKVIGAGANYWNFIQQTGASKPKEPVIFIKPQSSLITATGDLNKDVVLIPKIFNAINFEAELGIVIGKPGKNITRDQASNYIKGYCLSLDMTGMEFITKAREQKLPWVLGKAFDTATPVSEILSKDKLNPNDIKIWSKINGELKQSESTKGMIFSIGELIEYISSYMSLEENDLILTGTPAGAGEVHAGDVIECGLGENIVTMKFIVQKEK